MYLHELITFQCMCVFSWWTCGATGSRWAGSLVPTACVEAASAALSASVSGPPAPAGPPDVSLGQITRIRRKQWRAVGRGTGDGGMRWKESGRQAGRQGGNGVTLTEPAVDKTHRQIRQSRVWSLFCFPLLLLSGGISSLFSNNPPLSLLFLAEPYLWNLSSTLPLLTLSKQTYSNCYQTQALSPSLDWATFSPLASSLCFCFLSQCYERGRSLLWWTAESFWHSTHSHSWHFALRVRNFSVVLTRWCIRVWKLCDLKWSFYHFPN